MKKTIELDTEKAVIAVMRLIADKTPDMTKIDKFAISNGLLHAIDVIPNELLQSVLVQKIADETLKSLQDEELAATRKRINQKFSSQFENGGF